MKRTFTSSVLGLALLVGGGGAGLAQDIQWDVYVNCSGLVNYETKYQSGKIENVSGNRNFTLMISDDQNGSDFFIQTEGLNEDIQSYTADKNLKIQNNFEKSYNYYKLNTISLMYFDRRTETRGETANGTYFLKLFLDRRSGNFSFEMNRSVTYVADIKEYGSLSCVAADQKQRKF